MAVLVLALTAGVGDLAAAKDRATRTVWAPIVSGLEEPVAIAAAPGEPGNLYVVEKPGRIVVVRGGKVLRTFLDLSSTVGSQGSEQGLLSVAFSPGYAKNRLFYVDYTDESGDTRVDEYRSSRGVGVVSSRRPLLFVDQPYSNHNGGQLQFDRRGFLYVGMGDGGSGGDPENRAQNLSSQLGKLLRIDPSKPGTTWKIVGYGLRNPWRFSFDRANGNLWIGDVGQNEWEEVDVRAASKVGVLANYGWSVYEGPARYKTDPLDTHAALVKPVYVYSHNAGGCSITGGYVYRGAAIPALRGRYFFGDYCDGRIRSLLRTGSRISVRREPGTISQLTTFGQDLSGELYAASEAGTLFKLRTR
jgi:glucose/arabinose dehydrogenase